MRPIRLCHVKGFPLKRNVSAFPNEYIHVIYVHLTEDSIKSTYTLHQCIAHNENL